MMASFYYYDQDPSEFCFLAWIRFSFCYLNVTGTTKFKYEKKTQKNSGRSSKMTPSCKWTIILHSHKLKMSRKQRNVLPNKFFLPFFMQFSLFKSSFIGLSKGVFKNLFTLFFDKEIQTILFK